MIKYLGSKKKLIPAILSVTEEKTANVKSVLDLFSGTSRVGYALKEKGYQVLSNDLNTYAYMIAKCYVESDDNRTEEAEKLVQELNSLLGVRGYFTETFCEKSRYFQPKNGEKIDAIRERIRELESTLDEEMIAILLVSLMEAADRVDSTVGLQMAYLKQWASRSFKNLELRVPKLLPKSPHGSGTAFQGDAIEIVQRVSADLVYLDPPYNQHNYLGNYHIWETLVRWDKPAHYGVACKREDVRTRKSSFNKKKTIAESFQKILAYADCRYVLVSFNDEGFLSRDEITEMMRQNGKHLDVFEFEYKRHICSQIGIYNLKGEIVGNVGKKQNKEMLFLLEK